MINHSIVQICKFNL